ncbi:MAG: ABC transporter permease subunit [Methylomicrobium sp.]
MPELKSEAAASLSSSTGFYQRWRFIKDDCLRYGVIVGGLSIIAAIMLIFFYLLYVVWPLFISAGAEPVARYPVPERSLGETALLAIEEQNEIGARFTANGRVVFFSIPTGKTLSIHSIVLPDNAKISSFADGGPEKGVVAYGLSDGRVIVLKHQYRVSYPENRRVITPTVDYPLGREPLLLDAAGYALENLAIRVDEDQTTVVARTSDKRVLMSSFAKKRSLFDDDESFERTDSVLDVPAFAIEFIRIDKDQHNLYLADREGRLSFFDITDKSKPIIRQHLNVVDAGRRMTAMEFLNGSISLLIGDSAGQVSQWSVVRDARNFPAMQKIRAFQASDQAVIGIDAEQRRKGFIAIDVNGMARIFNTTAERELIEAKVSDETPKWVAMSPRANAFIVESEQGEMDFWTIENEHPEVSIKSLWQQVWYESYPKPDYIWQSSSASNDFEPKYSLTPLVFGTLKAAFYAMLIAVPMALMGAIYTAYFMAPGMRKLVKPTIEIMEALPTVILGFLAGLWLAPFVEEHLAGIFALLLTLPLTVLLFAYCWQFTPAGLRHKVPEGWDAALLVPVVIVGAWLAFAISGPLEALLFGGSLRHWLNAEWGIGYDQRNALVVGLAMGFAIIPTIFSIAEDAIFSVPKHLTIGSLALGATPWQTMMRVVLLTASPGIFSAVMIGLGRAVGETMIVLMATGNTPVMDLSIFQGMRTLSANIAVEMPESEVDSTHYRVLFLAALVLFTFTFVVNTLAELIRQRLREKYSSL